MFFLLILNLEVSLMLVGIIQHLRLLIDYYLFKWLLKVFVNSQRKLTHLSSVSPPTTLTCHLHSSKCHPSHVPIWCLLKCFTIAHSTSVLIIFLTFQPLASLKDCIMRLSKPFLCSSVVKDLLYRDIPVDRQPKRLMAYKTNSLRG